MAHVLTYKNMPSRRGRAGGGRQDPLPEELNRQGEVVAIVAAETEDLAQDALDAIDVEYEVLPFASTLEACDGAECADARRQGTSNLVRPPTAPKDFPNVTWASQQGDVEKGFAEADIVKEFTYHFCGRRLRSDPAGRQRRQMGRRQADGLGNGAGDLSVARRAGCRARDRAVEHPIHQQVQRLHVRGRRLVGGSDSIR